MKNKDKKPIYKKVWFWMVIILFPIILFSIYFTWIYVGISLVSPINPELPDIPKPNDVLYCEKDEDCIITLYAVDTCCVGCGEAINIEGGLYVEEWYKLNCVDSIYSGCPILECRIVCGAKCEDNKCKAIYNCP